MYGTKSMYVDSSVCVSVKWEESEQFRMMVGRFAEVCRKRIKVSTVQS